MKKTPTQTTLTAAIACVAAATLTLSACGGSDSSAAELPTVAPAASTSTKDQAGDATGATDTRSAGSEAVSADPDEAAAQFDRCLSDHGLGGMTGSVDENTPAGGTSFSAGSNDSQPPDATSPDMTPEAYDEAMAACKPYGDAAFGDATPDPELEAELADENLAAVQCLRDAGYDVEVDANGTLNHELAPDEDPAQYDAAMQQCYS